MKFSALLLAGLVILIEAESIKRKHGVKKQKRDSNASADQMVQNILHWLQDLYDSGNTRIVRQGSFLEYLPPVNTDKPRPFGYPPAGVTPFPPFPGPGMEYPSSPGVFPNEVLPPEPGTGSSTFFPDGPSTTVPGRGDIPSGGPGETLPPFPTFPNNRPSTPQGFTSQQPGGLPGQPTAGYPSIIPGQQPTVPSTLFPGSPSTFVPGRGTIPFGGPGETKTPSFPTLPTERPSTLQPQGFTPQQPGDTQQPGGFPSQPTAGYPSIIPGQQPTVPSTLFPGSPSTFVPRGETKPSSFPTFPAGRSTTLEPQGFPSQQPGETQEAGQPQIPGQTPTTAQEPNGYQGTVTSGPSQPSVPDQGFTGYPSGVPSTQQPSELTTQVASGGFPSYQSTGTPLQPGVDNQGSTGYPGGESTPQPEGGYSYPPGRTPFPQQPEAPEGYSTTSQPAGVLPEEEPTKEPSGVLPEEEPTKETDVPSEGPEGYLTTSRPAGVLPEGEPTKESGVSSEGPEGYPTTSRPAGVLPEREPTKETGVSSEGSTTAESGQPEYIPETPKVTQEPPVPAETEKPSSGFTPSIPRGFTTSPSTSSVETEGPPAVPAEGIPEESENAETTISPETNTIPQTGGQEPEQTEDDKHPPHIHAIDVQCGKEMMTINIEFNREFNGVIYSKGYYNMPECRYVQENSGQIKYSFTVNLNMCGTTFVNAFDTEGNSYLENVLVLQNEAGIQEQWDTIRAVRCLWEGNIKDTLSVAFSIGMLSQEIVTFSGDTAMAKLDVVLGRGPFGSPANGLVKIGENMTLVVSVTGDPAFDIQVKDCKAIDSTGGNTVQLTDENGCILKPKLFGAFQKTRDTGNTGASVIAFAHFNAFKFPDIMDLMIECNIELCKTDCEICQKEGESLDPILRRKRRDTANNTLADGVMMGKHLRIVLPEELETISEKLEMSENLCISLHSFVFSLAVLISLLTFTIFTVCYLWLTREKKECYLK